MFANNAGWKDSGLPVALRLRMQNGGFANGKWMQGQDWEVTRNVVQPYDAANVIKRAIRKRIAQRNYGPIPGEPARRTKVQQLRMDKFNYMRNHQRTWLGNGLSRVMSRGASALAPMFARQNDAARKRKGSILYGYWRKKGKI